MGLLQVDVCHICLLPEELTIKGFCAKFMHVPLIHYVRGGVGGRRHKFEEEFIGWGGCCVDNLGEGVVAF
eukprot:9107478-Ditylum_brightwellii.AAC.1